MNEHEVDVGGGGADFQIYSIKFESEFLIGQDE